jgi:hypothetical protein
LSDGGTRRCKRIVAGMCQCYISYSQFVKEADCRDGSADLVKATVSIERSGQGPFCAEHGGYFSCFEGGSNLFGSRCIAKLISVLSRGAVRGRDKGRSTFWRRRFVRACRGLPSIVNHINGESTVDWKSLSLEGLVSVNLRKFTTGRKRTRIGRRLILFEDGEYRCPR